MEDRDGAEERQSCTDPRLYTFSQVSLLSVNIGNRILMGTPIAIGAKEIYPVR